MSDVELFSPDRLRLARQRRGLFAQELAARVDVSVKAVGRWERGERQPDRETVTKIARVLDFPVDYFYGDAPPVLETAAFRSLARMTARQRFMALAAGSQAVAFDSWISYRFRRPEPNVPDLRAHDPESAAEAVRAGWGVGYQPIKNLVHLLEMNGVRIYSLVHDGSEIDAFSDWQNGTPYVFLNTTKTAERSRFDAAHELGHLVLHAHTGGASMKAQEDEAQEFASAFLMPAAPFVASAPRRVTLATIVDAKQKWGVSALAYVHRLHRLRLLSDWHYKSLCIQIKSSFQRTEPGPLRATEASQVLTKVLGNAGISRKEIVKELRIRYRDLDEMTFGLALTPLAGTAKQPTKTPSPEKSETEIRLMR